MAAAAYARSLPGLERPIIPPTAYRHTATIAYPIFRFPSPLFRRPPNSLSALSGRYIWDDDYIADTWIRDLVYVGVGLATLIGTGTFFNLAGTISPMAVLKQASVEHERRGV